MTRSLLSYRFFNMGKALLHSTTTAEALIIAVVSKLFMPLSQQAVVAEEHERPLGHERSG